MVSTSPNEWLCKFLLRGAFCKSQNEWVQIVRSHRRPPLTPVCYWPAQETKSPWPMYYLYLHPSPAIAAEYLDFLTHGQSNTASCTSHMCYCTFYLPIPWPEYRLHVRATKLLLVLAVEKFFNKFHFWGGTLCHLGLAGVQIACEVNIVASGVDAFSLSQSYTHTSVKVQVCSKWKISSHMASSQLWFLARLYPY